MYGYERLSHFLLQNTEKSPEELKSLLTGELIDFTGDCPQSDDITFMFIRFC
jgi:serine phosphatase RsbU (regulator of sigma subunit)